MRFGESVGFSQSAAALQQRQRPQPLAWFICLRVVRRASLTVIFKPSTVTDLWWTGDFDLMVQAGNVYCVV